MLKVYVLIISSLMPGNHIGQTMVWPVDAVHNTMVACKALKEERVAKARLDTNIKVVEAHCVGFALQLITDLFADELCTSSVSPSELAPVELTMKENEK
jgi:hypothetical protein